MHSRSSLGLGLAYLVRFRLDSSVSGAPGAHELQPGDAPPLLSCGAPEVGADNSGGGRYKILLK
jgi:hypothetical protein